MDPSILSHICQPSTLASAVVEAYHTQLDVIDPDFKDVTEGCEKVAKLAYEALRASGTDGEVQGWLVAAVEAYGASDVNMVGLTDWLVTIIL